ncbi:hypothetical protein GCM10010486_15300 [Nonomuraea roseoviolacea subsp. carminata]
MRREVPLKAQVSLELMDHLFQVRCLTHFTPSCRIRRIDRLSTHHRPLLPALRHYSLTRQPQTSASKEVSPVLGIWQYRFRSGEAQAARHYREEGQAAMRR